MHRHDTPIASCASTPAPWRESIRTWSRDRFRVEVFATSRTDWRGQTRLAYRFCDGDRLVFEESDFCGSPLHADDSDETVASLLTFLSLRPGDTDAEYFESYSPSQMEFAESSDCELLQWLYSEDGQGQLEEVDR